MSPSRYIEVDSRALTAIETVLKGKEVLYQEVMTWTTDGFIGKHHRVAYRIEEGCSVVEMECASLCSGPTSWGDLGISYLPQIL